MLLRYVPAILLGFSFCLTACNTVRPHPLTHFSASDQWKNPDEAKALYGKYHVKLTDGMRSKVGYSYLDAEDTIKYFSDSGGIEASQMAKEAVSKDNTGKKVAWIGFFGGIALMSIGSAIVPKEYVEQASLESARTLGQILIGSGMGLGSFSVLFYRPGAEQRFSTAADRFNQYLREQLHLEDASAL